MAAPAQIRAALAQMLSHAHQSAQGNPMGMPVGGMNPDGPQGLGAPPQGAAGQAQMSAPQQQMQAPPQMQQQQGQDLAGPLSAQMQRHNQMMTRMLVQKIAPYLPPQGQQMLMQAQSPQDVPVILHQLGLKDQDIDQLMSL